MRLIDVRKFQKGRIDRDDRIYANAAEAFYEALEAWPWIACPDVWTLTREEARAVIDSSTFGDPSVPELAREVMRQDAVDAALRNLCAGKPGSLMGVPVRVRPIRVEAQP